VTMDQPKTNLMLELGQSTMHRRLVHAKHFGGREG
jgi:hypothetical protein